MQFLTTHLHKQAQISSEKGFTLIEIITVILILGIIGVMGSDVITSSFRGFSETDARMELFEEGKLAMMRMEREIHHMVPNAIDDPTNARTINFGLIDVNTLTSTTTPITGQYLPVGVAANAQIRDLSKNALDGAFISIYNTSWDNFSLLTPRRIYLTTQVGNNMSLDKPIISHGPIKRYYPVQWIVRYSFDATTSTLSRSQAAISLAGNLITDLDNATAYPLLTHIDALTFNYSPASLTSNALVSINFTLTNKGNTLHFHKEIQVRNVP
jgi:MSHA biogenesis protein MshO